MAEAAELREDGSGADPPAAPAHASVRRRGGDGNAAVVFFPPVAR